MKLVVGLGNPGKKYARTRHNAGFWWVERLARAAGVELRSDGKFHGHAVKLSQPAEIWLLMPDTFMNNSGRAVAALATFYKIEPREILVVNDELDLAPGVARLKFGGGISGHNGLRDIAECLGSRDFWRLRIGHVRCLIIPIERQTAPEASPQRRSHCVNLVKARWKSKLGDRS